MARFIGDRGGGSGANKAAAQRMTNPSTLATSPSPTNHLDSAPGTKRSVNVDLEGSGKVFFPAEKKRGGGHPQSANPHRGTRTLKEFSSLYFNPQVLN